MAKYSRTQVNEAGEILKEAHSAVRDFQEGMQNL